MDLLLQRLGRLHRHTRKRPANVTKPCCAVLGANAETLEEGSRFVYGDWLLLQTKRLLPNSITLPQDIPMLVQDTYQEPQDTSELDETAQQAWNDYCGHLDSQKAEVYYIPKPNISKRYANLEFDFWFTHYGFTRQWGTSTGNGTRRRYFYQCFGDDAKKDGQISFYLGKTRVLLFLQIMFRRKKNAGKLHVKEWTCPERFVLVNIWQNHWRIRTHEQSSHSEWQQSFWIKGELVLLLNEACSAELCGFHITYTQEEGLRYRKDKNMGNQECEFNLLDEPW